MTTINNVPKPIIAYAFRYAIGRETGAIDDVIDCISRNLDLFDIWELMSIVSDINWHHQVHNMKRPSILNFRDHLMVHIDNLEYLKDLGSYK